MHLVAVPSEPKIYRPEWVTTPAPLAMVILDDLVQVFKNDPDMLETILASLAETTVTETTIIAHASRHLDLPARTRLELLKAGVILEFFPIAEREILDRAITFAAAERAYKGYPTTIVGARPAFLAAAWLDNVSCVSPSLIWGLQPATTTHEIRTEDWINQLHPEREHAVALTAGRRQSCGIGIWLYRKWEPRSEAKFVVTPPIAPFLKARWIAALLSAQIECNGVGLNTMVLPMNSDCDAKMAFKQWKLQRQRWGS